MRGSARGMVSSRSVRRAEHGHGEIRCHRARRRDEGEFAVGNLTVAGLAADLSHSLDEMGHSAACARMRATQETTVGVQWKLSTEIHVPLADERSGLAPSGDAEILDLHGRRDREAVVDLSDVEIVDADAG